MRQSCRGLGNLDRGDPPPVTDTQESYFYQSVTLFSASQVGADRINLDLLTAGIWPY